MWCCPFRELAMVFMQYALTHQDVLDEGDGTDGSLYDSYDSQRAVYTDPNENSDIGKFSSTSPPFEPGAWMVSLWGVSPISSSRTSNSANLTAIVILKGTPSLRARPGEER